MLSDVQRYKSLNFALCAVCLKEFKGMGTYQDEEREICKYTYTLAD
ncbi:MAG: hypothetical protein IKK10_00555 [Clostridia bacterium]|nr:hypothetical protein [Clostridia bacterium]